MIWPHLHVRAFAAATGSRGVTGKDTLGDGSPLQVQRSEPAKRRRRRWRPSISWTASAAASLKGIYLALRPVRHAIFRDGVMGRKKPDRAMELLRAHIFSKLVILTFDLSYAEIFSRQGRAELDT